MQERVVDQEITLIPYFPNPDVTLSWYQDPEVCKQVDDIDHVYTPEMLNRMYDFLNNHGLCYYIQYKGTLVGDVTLRDNAEICIVIRREFQNMRIGRRCVLSMLDLAREKGYREVRANIFPFNLQSQKMFLSVGFRQISEAWYTYELLPNAPQ